MFVSQVSVLSSNERFFLGGLLKQFRLDLKSKDLFQQQVGGKPRKVWFLL